MPDRTGRGPAADDRGRDPGGQSGEERRRGRDGAGVSRGVRMAIVAVLVLLAALWLGGVGMPEDPAPGPAPDHATPQG